MFLISRVVITKFIIIGVYTKLYLDINNTLIKTGCRMCTPENAFNFISRRYDLINADINCSLFSPELLIKVFKYSHIPYEIISQILANIKDKALLQQCQLTCKKWSQAAQEQTYKEVELYTDNKAKRFFATLAESSSSPGFFLKYLELNDALFKNEEDNYDPAQHISLIVTPCPNVEALYLPQFKAIDKRLTQEREKGNLQQVRDLSMDQKPSALLHISNIMLAFRSTIELSLYQ
jgi:hypothetical protein